MRPITLSGPPRRRQEARLAMGRGPSPRGAGTGVPVWVEAAPARNARRPVCGRIAHALRLQRLGEDPLETLLRALASEQGLVLVLDNLEQVLDAAPAVERRCSRGPPRCGCWPRAGRSCRATASGSCSSSPCLPPTLRRCSPIGPCERLWRRAGRGACAGGRAGPGWRWPSELAAARTRVLSIAQIRAQTSSSLRLLAGKMGNTATAACGPPSDSSMGAGEHVGPRGARSALRVRGRLHLRGRRGRA